MDWTTFDTRYESAGISGTQELSPTNSLIQDDFIPVEHVHLSDDEDSENDHLLKANLRKDRCHSPSVPDGGVSQDAHRSGHVTIQTQFFFSKALEYLRYGSKGRSPALSISKMKIASYPDFGLELLMPKKTSSILTDMLLCRVKKKSDQTCGFSLSSELKPTQETGHLDHLHGSDKRILSTAVKLWTQNLVIRQRVEDFQLGIESYQTQLNLTKPGWDATSYEFKHDYTIIESP
nr:hypothetical protein [Tanacetum cinerariifolium]